MSRIVVFAAWVMVVLGIQWHRSAPHFREAILAFQGPAAFNTDVLRHLLALSGAVALVGAFWLAARGMGATLIAWTGRPHSLRDREERPMTLILGFGMYGCMTVAFGLCGLFFRSRALAILVPLAVLGLRDLRRVRRVSDRGPVPAEVNWFKWAAIACVLLLSLLSITPETWIDSLAYHLTAPQDFNKTHKWMDVHQGMYRYPLLPEGIYGQGMIIGGEKAALLLNLSGTLLTLWLLWAWAVRLAGPVAGWLAVLALVSSDQVAFHMGQANQGMFSVGFALLGVWAWMFTARGPRSARWALIAGMGLGWSLCAKYTACAAVFGIMAWHLLRMGRRPGRELASLAWLILGMTAASAPFLVNGWLFTRNPFYPLFFGGLDWTDENMKMLYLFGCVGYDFSLSDAKAVAWTVFRLVTEEQPLLLLALPGVVSLRDRYWRPFAFAWTGALAAWSVGVPCLRLMMPMFPAITLISAVAVAPWFAAGGARRVMALGATAAVLALGVIDSVGAADVSKRSLAAALRLETPERYRARILTTYHEAVDAVNAVCDPADRLLVLGDARGYGFRPLAFNRDVEDTPAMLDLARGAWTPEEIGKRLKQTGVRYVLLNYVTSEYLSHYWNQVFTWRPEEIRRAWEYWRGYGEVVWRSTRADGINGGYVLYRLRERPRQAAAMMPFLPGAEPAGIRRDGEDWTAYARRMESVRRFAPGVVFFEARLATALFRAGRAQDALAVATRALDCDYPEKEVLHGIRAYALQAMRRYPEALAAAKEAEALRPGEPSLVRLRKDCERLTGTPRRR